MPAEELTQLILDELNRRGKQVEETEASARVRDRIAATVASVGRIDPTSANADRLEACYKNAYVPDRALFDKIFPEVPVVRHRSASVDGLTENMTSSDFLALLSGKHTTGMQVLSRDPTGLPDAYIIVSHGGDSQQEKNAFTHRIIGNHRSRSNVQFEKGIDEVKASFINSLRKGRLLYIDELYSAKRMATLALAVALRNHVEELEREKRVPFDGLCAKSLMRVCCGTRTIGGNSPILTMNELMGMGTVAQIVKTRIITVPAATCRECGCTPETIKGAEIKGDAMNIPVQLVFSLYYATRETLMTAMDALRSGHVTNENPKTVGPQGSDSVS